MFVLHTISCQELGHLKTGFMYTYTIYVVVLHGNTWVLLWLYIVRRIIEQKAQHGKLIVNPTGILCLEYLLSTSRVGKIASHRNSIYPGRPNSRPLCMLNDAKSMPKRAPGFLNKWFVTW